MAETGHSMWNGNYGYKERARREAYPPQSEITKRAQDVVAKEKAEKTLGVTPSAPDWSKVIKE